jgi:hypothetical protein
MNDAEAGILLTSNVLLVGYTALRLARSQSKSTLDLPFYGLLSGVIEAVGICVVLGAVGLLGWLEVLIAEVIIAVYARYRTPVPTRTSLGSVMWWPAVIASVVILSISIVIALSSRSMDADTITYHVVNASTWLHNGNIWQLPFTNPNGPDATAPGNADIFTTWLLLPSHSDQLACITPIVFGSLCVLATAQLARSLGATTLRGVAVGLAIIVAPIITLTQSRSALVDLAGPAYVVSALVLALRARIEDRGFLWIGAGVCLGLAAGSKVVALPPSIFALFIAVTLASTRRRHAGALLIAGYIPFASVWYVRNWVEAGNPLFPDVIRLGPLNLRGAPLADNTSVLTHLLMGHWAIVGNVAGIVAEVVGPVLAMLVVAMIHVRHTKRLTGRLSVLTALMIFGYLVTPYTGGGPAGHTDEIATAMRYLFPALFVAGSVTAAVLNPRTFKILGAISALYGAAIFVTKASQFRSDLTFTLPDIATATLIALGSCGSIAIATKMFRSGHVPSRPNVAAAVLVACVGAILLYGRIPAEAPDGVVQTLGNRVAAIGVPYPRLLLGADLSTTVLSVGAGPQGAQTVISDQQAFDAALADLNVNVLAVGWTTGLAPNGWTVGNNWVEVGQQAGATVYRRR